MRTFCGLSAGLFYFALITHINFKVFSYLMNMSSLKYAIQEFGKNKKHDLS